jgi:hypothetical protein
MNIGLVQICARIDNVDVCVDAGERSRKLWYGDIRKKHPCTHKHEYEVLHSIGFCFILSRV